VYGNYFLLKCFVNLKLFLKTSYIARCQGFMHVILATQEAEIKRIEVQSQPKANSSRYPISKISNTKQGCWSSSSGRMSA
jgi:hypothetical protein